jgi:hypothetical protein
MLCALCAAILLSAQQRKDDGYRGIWFYDQPSQDEYVYKYSGGFATYPQQQLPIAYYSKEANKTFFCYGGTVKGAQQLLHMVSYYDHATGEVPRPTVLLNKDTADAHDNPVLMLDGAGYIWVFSNSHGTKRPSHIYKSAKPYSVDAFERILTTNFSYGQPWYIPGRGFFLETRDQGETWTNARRETVRTPLAVVQNPALVHDYRAEHLLVYLKDLQFDGEGHPVLMYLTSRGYASGPANDPRLWHTARWTGNDWEIRRVTASDHNYDYGSLYIEADGTWRIIAPTDPGPQPYCTGGEMVMWTSRDRGRSWIRLKQLTANSRFNHTYARRPVKAHPGFYALWADGDAKKPSESCLYFTDREGNHVWRLPPVMKQDFERPQMVR